MTCHVALTGRNFGILLSDSQGTAGHSLFHGWQKQVVGENFLLGVAGSGLALEELHSAVHERQPPDPAQFVRDFVNEQLTATARDQVEIVLVHSNPPVVRQFIPGHLTDWCRPGNFGAIGSGAEYVNRARARDEALGLTYVPTSLLDGLLWTLEYAQVSDESVTVDDRYLVGMLLEGRSYLFGDADLRVSRANPRLQEQWRTASQHYEMLQDLCSTIQAESVAIQSAVQNARRGVWTDAEQQAVSSSSAAIHTMREAFKKELVAFIQWYDALVGRPSLSRHAPAPGPLPPASSGT
jgi:hypothetical protein